MKSEKGQVTLFVIVAIAILGIIVFLLYFRGGALITPSTDFSPQSYLRTCIAEDLQTNTMMLARQGGYANPEGYVAYNDDKIKYLCYSSENYKTCTVQQPLIKEHFEAELNALVKPRAESCLSLLKAEYEKRGYDTSIGTAMSNTYFSPGKLVVDFLTPITVTKAGVARSFNGFTIETDSEMYDLLMISVSIIDYESTYGDSETGLYLQYYPDLKIEKTRLDEGSKIYRVTNVVTNETFSFASRSLVWPPGYGIV